MLSICVSLIIRKLEVECGLIEVSISLHSAHQAMVLEPVAACGNPYEFRNQPLSYDRKFLKGVIPDVLVFSA